MVTGHDVCRFEQKGKDAFEWVNTAKIIYTANTAPPIHDKSSATWNRAVMIPFEWTVPKDRQNPAFLTPAFWADELPGVLNWALEGLKRLRSQGWFTKSAKCDALKAEHRKVSDPATALLEAHYEADTTGSSHVLSSEMYRGYLEYAVANGHKHTVAAPVFGQVVGNVFSAARSIQVKAEKSNVKAWQGVQPITAVVSAVAAK